MPSLNRGPRWSLRLYDGKDKLIQAFFFRVNPQVLSVQQATKGGVHPTLGDAFVDSFGLMPGRVSLAGQCGKGGLAELARIKEIWERHVEHDEDIESPPYVILEAPNRITDDDQAEGMRLRLWLDSIGHDQTVDQAFMWPYHIEATILADLTSWRHYAEQAPPRPYQYDLLEGSAALKRLAVNTDSGAPLRRALNPARLKRSGTSLTQFLTFVTDQFATQPNMATVLKTVIGNVLALPTDMTSLARSSKDAYDKMANGSFFQPVLTRAETIAREASQAREEVEKARQRAIATKRLDRGTEAKLHAMQTLLTQTRAQALMLRQQALIAKMDNQRAVEQHLSAGRAIEDFQPKMRSRDLPNLLRRGPAVSPQSGFAETSGDYVVIAGDTLQMIAKRMLGDMGAWRVLARLNGIKAPYTLTPGQVLRLHELASPGGRVAAPVPPDEEATTDSLPAEIPLVTIR